jgi:hypothetical protein
MVARASTMPAGSDGNGWSQVTSVSREGRDFSAPGCSRNTGAGWNRGRRRPRDGKRALAVPHMIEETACHAGHLAIARTLPDGRTNLGLRSAVSAYNWPIRARAFARSA